MITVAAPRYIRFQTPMPKYARFTHAGAQSGGRQNA